MAPTASRTPELSEPHARGYALLSDDVEGKVLLIGGFDCPGCDPTFAGFSDMWAFDSDGTWNELTPDLIPPPADDFAYDRQSRRAVLVEIQGKTWSYNPADNRWEALDVQVGPSALHGSRMVYDVESDRMIVFGGDAFTEQSMHDDTWAFDLDSLTWEQMDPEERPPITTYFVMAYDVESDRAILFGGVGPLDGTWAYDYASDRWREMQPATSPPARVYAAAAYDARSDRVILYGGSVDEETATLQDTWAYDYNTDAWTQISAESPMGPLAWHAMAGTSNGILLFGGGVSRDEYRSDTWILDATDGTWSPV